MKDYYQYAEDVREGKAVVCEYIRQAVNRFYRLVDDERYDFREEEADRKIGFISYLKHFTGRHNGKSFILEPWQSFIAASIYGFYDKEGNRLVQNVLS